MTDGQKYQTLVRREPEVGRLVGDLDLRDPRTGLPYGMEPVSETTRQRLSSIAGRLLLRGRIYSPAQVIRLLEEDLKIPRERAVRGFSLMVSTGVLTDRSGVRLSM